MNIYDRNKNDTVAELEDKVQESNQNNYLEDISEIEPSYGWFSTTEARWLTRQDEIINFW